MRLTRLEVTGGNLPPAVFDFRSGLNVISGPENRGKSYAMRCLNFLFGAKEGPQAIRESLNYEAASLQFSLNDNKYGAIRRSLVSRECFGLSSETSFSLATATGWRKLSAKPSPKKESISSFWFALLGFTATRLRANQSGKTGAFTVRHLAHWVLADETRMGRDESPVVSGRGFADASFHDAFAVLLGARLNPPSDVRQSEANSSGALRHTVLSELLEDVQQSISAIPSTGVLSREESGVFSVGIEEHRQSIARLSVELDEIFKQREEKQNSLISARSAAIARTELRSRLQLLSDYYQSDLRRLDAIAETSHYLGQLEESKCPVCSQNWTPSADPNATFESNRVVNACRREAQKIWLLTRDIEREMALVDNEAMAAKELSQEEERHLRALALSFGSLEQQLVLANTQFSALLGTAPGIADRLALQRQRDLLLKKIELGNDEIAHPRKKEATRYSHDPIQEVCAIATELLKSWRWHYSEGEPLVSFDETTADLVVSGSLRTSFGKAVRGLIVSAFCLALMEYCVNHGLPHPGFVVLDSPLTAHGGQDGAGRADEVSLSMQTAFFEEIAIRYRNLQVLVIDNKDPPSSLAGKINHIRFGDESEMRPGFFPRKTL